MDASDLPFRLLCTSGGATATYTQMYIPHKLESDIELRERALLDLQYESNGLSIEEKRPTIVQLGGRDIDELVRAARIFEGHCQGIDINVGCPQRHALKGGYGSSLLARKEWSQLENIGETFESRFYFSGLTFE